MNYLENDKKYIIYHLVKKEYVGNNLEGKNVYPFRIGFFLSKYYNFPHHSFMTSNKKTRVKCNNINLEQLIHNFKLNFFNGV